MTGTPKDGKSECDQTRTAEKIYRRTGIIIETGKRSYFCPCTPRKSNANFWTLINCANDETKTEEEALASSLLDRLPDSVPDETKNEMAKELSILETIRKYMKETTGTNLTSSECFSLMYKAWVNEITNQTPEEPEPFPINIKAKAQNLENGQ